MTVIIKEKAVLVYTGKTWVNLAQSQTITQTGDDRIVIAWASGKIQGFDRAESQQILKALEEMTK